jgi:hypothetical protein
LWCPVMWPRTLSNYCTSSKKKRWGSNCSDSPDVTRQWAGVSSCWYCVAGTTTSACTITLALVAASSGIWSTQ